MSSQPLSKNDLYLLTGYMQPKKQIEWLRKELGIEPPIGKDGRPRVSQAVVDRATLARSSGAIMSAQASPSTAGPKWKVAA